MIAIGDLQSMLRVHEAVAAGAIVGILADRSPDGARQVSVPFFGRPAPFPTGPFVLAASLGAPVLLFRGVRTGPRRYHVAFAPFADRIVLRRATRRPTCAAVSRAMRAGWRRLPRASVQLVQLLPVLGARRMRRPKPALLLLLVALLPPRAGRRRRRCRWMR